MKLITCGSCNFMGGEKELKSYSIMTTIPQCSGMKSPIQKVKIIFEDMPIVQVNSDLFYEGCPVCESQLIFYKEINSPTTLPSSQSLVKPEDIEILHTEKITSKPIEEKTKVTPPERTPRTRSVESTTTEAVCDSCSKTFKSSNNRSGGFGGKCPNCTNALLG